ncbi:hypothetical protein RI367_004606 [Sorochytrium milnesiophthora]
MSTAFRALNALCGILLVIAGIWSFFPGVGDFKNIVIAAYAIFFGVIILLLEGNFHSGFVSHPSLSFLFTWSGRGFFYFFWGWLILLPVYYTFGFIAGVILIVVGLVYIIMEFAAPSYSFHPHMARRSIL